MNSQDYAHREAVSKTLSSVGQRYFKLIEFDAEEELVMEIRKHWFGEFLIIITGMLVATAILVTSLLISQNLSQPELGINAASSDGLVMMIGFLLAIVTAVVTLAGLYIYHSNAIFVTSEKIAQVVYPNLIDRKISQLSIGDVQDVTVSQKGIFARIFKYGTLVIETAGEQQNYTFTYVPTPYEASQSIVGAHEQNLKQYGN